MNVIIVVLTFLSAPLQARALGAAGRGDLAAILVPLGLAPVIASLGLGTYASRQAARGRPLAPLVGTIGLLLLLTGGVAAALGPLVAGLAADGREVVRTYVVVGFLLLPLSLLNWLLTDIAVGRERWRAVITVRLLPPVIGLVGIVSLYVMDRLTVASAAIVSIAPGLAAAIVLLPQLRGTGRLRFDASIAREAVPFGLTAWLGGLGSIANVRLDQLLMIRLVDAKELGLYVVAFSIAGVVVNPLVSALAAGAFPRFATGETALIARVLRTTVLGVAVTSLGIAIIAPVVVPLLFGPDFSGAVPLVWLLLLAGVPLAGITVLSTALTSRGSPGFSAWSEVVSLCITVPGLFLLLPVMGATGAALVSLLAYTASFTLLLGGSRARLRLAWAELLVVRRDDVTALRMIGAEQLGRLRSAVAGRSAP